MKGARMYVYIRSCCVVFCVVLSVMCFCVIYKFLSLGLDFDRQQDLGKQSWKIAKPGLQHGKQSKPLLLRDG
jgi:hypothetical protein